MSYRIAGIDVHKKMLAVAVADVEVDGDFQFEQRSYLETLCRETGEEFDETLSKADASKRIDQLRERSARLAGE
jgi:DUF3072 family protein